MRPNLIRTEEVIKRKENEKKIKWNSIRCNNPTNNCLNVYTWCCACLFPSWVGEKSTHLRTRTQKDSKRQKSNEYLFSNTWHVLTCCIKIRWCVGSIFSLTCWRNSSKNALARLLIVDTTPLLELRTDFLHERISIFAYFIKGETFVRIFFLSPTSQFEEPI